MDEDLTAVIPTPYEAARHTMPFELTFRERNTIRWILAVRWLTRP